MVVPRTGVAVTVTGLTGAWGRRLVAVLREGTATLQPGGYMEYEVVGMFEADIDADPYSTTQVFRLEKRTGERFYVTDPWPWLREEAAEVTPGKYRIYLHVGEPGPGPSWDELTHYCWTSVTKGKQGAATVTVGPIPPTTDDPDWDRKCPTQ